MALLQVHTLTKRFSGSETPAVSSVDFSLEEGELLALVGESGSGKTTLLRMLAGLEWPDAGEIHLDGKIISQTGGGTAPEQRGIGFVFQNHALFPHLTVERNISFGLRRLNAGARADVVADLLALVGLSGFEKRFPHELSGGESQRVALVRSLAPNPRLLLLDEPFSSLDAGLRESLREETRAILQRRGTTAIFVTHDIDDTLSTADRVVLLRNGTVQQTGTPHEVYHAPVNRYVASFFGPCNFLPPGMFVNKHAVSGETWIRPEALALADPGVGVVLQGCIRRVHFRGAFQDVFLECRDASGGVFSVNVRHDGARTVQVGESWGIVQRTKG